MALCILRATLFNFHETSESLLRIMNRWKLPDSYQVITSDYDNSTVFI